MGLWGGVGRWGVAPATGMGRVGREVGEGLFCGAGGDGADASLQLKDNHVAQRRDDILLLLLF